MPPDPIEAMEEAGLEPPPPPDDPPAKDPKAPAPQGKPGEPAAPPKPGDPPPKPEGPSPGEAPPAIVDENAPKLELTASPFADAANGFRVSISLTTTNVGHRAVLVAIRSRMVGFRVEGPEGTFSCGAPYGRARAIGRDGYQSLKPGGKSSLTVLVEEACGTPIFRRPGLYVVTPELRLMESGDELGLAAYTGVVRAKEPTLVRIATGPEPYHGRPPRPVKPAKQDTPEVAGR
jgi:hypothetical protein